MLIEVINELKKYTLGKINTDKVEISVLKLNRIIKALEKELTNNLGVDCISRQAVLEITAETGALETQNRVKALSPVTPIRPKGHWKLVQRGKLIDVCCSNCEAVRIKEYAYNYTIDQLDKEDVKECLESDDMRYCPYCGSDNREVEE